MFPLNWEKKTFYELPTIQMILISSKELPSKQSPNLSSCKYSQHIVPVGTAEERCNPRWMGRVYHVELGLKLRKPVYTWFINLL